MLVLHVTWAKNACLLLRAHTARVYAGRADRIFVTTVMSRLAAAYRVILLQIHHSSNVAVAVSQAVRWILLWNGFRRTAGALVHLDSPANTKATAR